MGQFEITAGKTLVDALTFDDKARTCDGDTSVLGSIKFEFDAFITVMTVYALGIICFCKEHMTITYGSQTYLPLYHLISVDTVGKLTSDPNVSKGFLEHFSRGVVQAVCEGNSGNPLPQTLPTTKSPEFIDFVKAFLDKMGDASEDVYGITFEDSLPQDLPVVKLTASVTPCELRSPTQILRDKDIIPTHVDIATRLIIQHGMCRVGAGNKIIAYDRDSNHYITGLEAIHDLIIRCIYRHMSRDKLREFDAYVSHKSVLNHYDDLDLRYIVFNNCVVDTAVRREDGTYPAYHLSPSWRTDGFVPTDYNPSADKTALHKYIRDGVACGRDDVYLNICEVLGFEMYRGASGYFVLEHCSDGRENSRNGKSSTNNGFAAVFGGDGNYPIVTRIEMGKIGGDGKKFNTAEFEYSRVNIGGDISDTHVDGDAVSLIKDMVDGEAFPVEVKGIQGLHSAVSTTQHIYACNNIPRFALDPGFLNRIWGIPFNAHFNSNQSGYDKNLKRAIWDDPETVQAFVLDGLDALYGLRQNKMTPSFLPEHYEIIGQIEQDNNSVAQWISDRGYNREILTARFPICVVRDDIHDYTERELDYLSKELFGWDGIGARNYRMHTPIVMTQQQWLIDYKAWAINHNAQPFGLGRFVREVENHMHIKRMTNASSVKHTNREVARFGYMGKQDKTGQFFRLPTDGKPRHACESDDIDVVIDEYEKCAEWLTRSSAEEIQEVIIKAGKKVPEVKLTFAEHDGTFSEPVLHIIESVTEQAVAV